jgi:hypothetical protein
MQLINRLKYLSGGIHHIKRSNYKVIDQSDIDHFRTILKPNQIITDDLDL